VTAANPTTAVLIPFGGRCVHRARALAWVLEQYHRDHPDWQVIVGRYDHEPWIKARAVAFALNHTDADVVVIADGDMYCPDTVLAVDEVRRSRRWACPYLWVDRLDEAATDEFVATGVAGAGLVEPSTHGQIGGGIVVLPRAMYEECPLDPRFLGWGHEDAAFGLALGGIFGEPWRGAGRAWHLWHPPAERLSRSKGTEANKALWLRYQEWVSFPVLIRKLVAEHHTPPHHPGAGVQPGGILAQPRGSFDSISGR
jgi:hypothetical protein